MESITEPFEAAALDTNPLDIVVPYTTSGALDTTWGGTGKVTLSIGSEDDGIRKGVKKL